MGLCVGGLVGVDLMAQPLNHSNSGVPLSLCTLLERRMYRETADTLETFCHC